MSWKTGTSIFSLEKVRVPFISASAKRALTRRQVALKPDAMHRFNSSRSNGRINHRSTRGNITPTLYILLTGCPVKTAPIKSAVISLHGMHFDGTGAYGDSIHKIGARKDWANSGSAPHHPHFALRKRYDDVARRPKRGRHACSASSRKAGIQTQEQLPLWHSDVSGRTSLLHVQGIGSIGARIQQHDFHRATIFGVADVRVPVLRYLAGYRFVG